MNNTTGNNSIIKEFTIYNGTPHDALLIDPKHTHFNRKHKFVSNTPEVKPVATKESDGAINVNSTNNKVPPTIDTTGLLLPQDNFYVPHIEIPNSRTDIVIASDRYIWACLHNQKDLPPFYLDRLYNPQPVYDHDPDLNHAKYFKTPAKIVGYVLRAVMTPYAPWEYMQAINSGIPVSAASLKSCIMYYTQEKVKTKEMMRGYTGLFEHIAFLQKQLEYQVAMNQNLPDYMFPTAIDSKPITPDSLNQVLRPVAVTFEA